MFIERKIYPQLKKHLPNKQISVITGLRRTGKTTLVKRLLEEIKTNNKLYIDLERVDNRELFAEKNYDNIIGSLKAMGLNINKKIYLGIDEIQLVPEITSALKYLYDHYDFKFIVTGSSSYYLKNLFTESLSGRKKIFELYPLDFGEFLKFKKIVFRPEDFTKKRFLNAEYERLKKYYEEYIKYGGFPEVVLAGNHSDKKDLLLDIISSYVNIDIKILADFRNDKNIYKLIKLLAGRVGTRLDYLKISRLIDISRITVQNYIDFFEKTYLIKRVSVLAKNPDREIVKAQKVYFCDTGLAGVLVDLDSGAKFENTVFNQLIHHGEIKYYSLKSGQELDFILNNKIAFEIKESPTQQDLKKAKQLAGLAGIKKTRLIGKNFVPKFTDYIWGGAIR
jgi:hypothetical protein